MTSNRDPHVMLLVVMKTTRVQEMAVVYQTEDSPMGTCGHHPPHPHEASGCKKGENFFTTSLGKVEGFKKQCVPVHKRGKHVLRPQQKYSWQVNHLFQHILHHGYH